MHKTLISATLLLMLSLLMPDLRAQEAKQDAPFNPQREDYRFVVLFEKFKEVSASQIEEKKRNNQLLDVGTKLAAVYFENTEQSLQNRYITYLKQQHDTANPTLKRDYTLLGRAFYDFAAKAVAHRELVQKQNRIIFTIGGAVVGLVVGAVTYEWGLPLLKRTFGWGIEKSLQTAILMYGGGLVLGTGAGYGGSYAYNSFVLPLDTRTQNGAYFKKTFSGADDFVKKTFDAGLPNADLMDAKELLAKLEALRDSKP